LLRRDPVHPGARHLGAAGRRGDRRVPPRHVREAGLLRPDQVPAPARVADRQAARLGGGGAESQGRRHDGQEGAAGLPGRARHGADHDRRLRQQDVLSPGPRPVLSRAAVALDGERQALQPARRREGQAPPEGSELRAPARALGDHARIRVHVQERRGGQAAARAGRLQRRPPGARLGHAQQSRAEARAVGRGLHRPRVHRRSRQPHRVPLQLVGQLVQRGEGAAAGRAGPRERREEAQGPGRADAGHLLRGRRPREARRLLHARRGPPRPARALPHRRADVLLELVAGNGQMSAPGGWRARAGTPFSTEKQPVRAARGMVVTNHPLASAAGAEMLAGGGNAVDAAIAALFALTVVEPMMVGIFGAGHAQVYLAGRVHTAIDGYTTEPAAARPDMYRPVSDSWPDYMEAVGRENSVGPKSVGVPGNLAAWCEMLARFGTFDLATVMAPAIRHAEHGFRVTGYLAECLAEAAPDLASFPASARVFLPGGAPLRKGERLVQADYAATLRTIAKDGPPLLYGGALGRRVADYMAQSGGLITLDDLTRYRTVERAPVRGTYRGFEIVGCPPPTGGGVHLLQILNVLEGYDVAGLGFGTVDGIHLLAEALKIAFADRAAATGDPAFVDVPVARLIAKD